MSLAETQRIFTQHMRDPARYPAPAGIEDRRMAIYSDLLYRNVESFMANSFPILRKIHDDSAWQLLIRAYFRDHQAHTPYFPKMPQEFLHYLEMEYESKVTDYPFMLELAHYEWIEMSIALDSRDLSDIEFNAQGDFLTGIPLLSPTTQLLHYEYPVHKIGPDFLPKEKPEQPTYLLVYRNTQDQVGFIELNPVSARLLDRVNQNTEQTGQELLELIAHELQHPQPEQVIQGGLLTLQALKDKAIVPGTRV